MTTARDVIAMCELSSIVIAEGREFDGTGFVGTANANYILSALAEVGFKIVAREPTFEQVLSVVGLVVGALETWAAMWDAAEPRGPKETT